ncbi:MAG: transporter [Coriobacteriia bacterium]|nr:transporter [Coriobacteriia bacterium]
MGSMTQVVLYGTLCSIGLFAGSVVSSRWWTPSAQMKSYIQHVAAGLVFAAVGVEILPDMLERAIPGAAAIGFIIGVALVMGIEFVAEKIGEKQGGESPWSMIGVISTDLFIDGILIGVATVAGGEGGSQALLVTIALVAEVFSLGLSTGCALTEFGFSKNKVMVTGALMALAPLGGAIGGYLVGGFVSPAVTEGILALAAAALLYLAVEELLKEAHEVKETPLATLLFFGAFFAIMMADMWS